MFSDHLKKIKKDLTKVEAGYIQHNTNVRNFGGVSTKLSIFESMYCNCFAVTSLCILYISEIIIGCRN